MVAVGVRLIVGVGVGVRTWVGDWPRVVAGIRSRVSVLSSARPLIAVGVIAKVGVWPMDGAGPGVKARIGMSPMSHIYQHYLRLFSSNSCSGLE